MNRALASGRRGGGDESTDFKSALTGVAIGFCVGIGKHGILVLPRPAIQKILVPIDIDHAAVGRGGPMGNPAGADQCDPLRHGVSGAAQRFAECPCPVQRRQGRPLAIDIARNDGKPVVGIKEMQRHHDAVIEAPFFGIGGIDSLLHFDDQPARQTGIAANGPVRNAQPLSVLDRAIIAFRHPQRIGRHVVHEEVREMLGGDDDQRIGPRGMQGVAHITERLIERLA